MFFKRKKKSKRPIFGFPCDLNIAIVMKATAKIIGAPIYPTVEHILQLGAAALEPALHDDLSKHALTEHIMMDHLLVQNIDLENEYDVKVAKEAKLIELARQEYEKCVDEFIKICDKYDIDPWFLLAIAEDRVKELLAKRQIRNEIPRRNNPLKTNY